MTVDGIIAAVEVEVLKRRSGLHDPWSLTFAMLGLVDVDVLIQQRLAGLLRRRSA